MNSDQKPPKAGLSLYAHLLEPSSHAPGTISSAPVSYQQQSDAQPEHDEAAKKQQALAASLQFQPTKRPQLAAQKARAKAIASKFAPPAKSSSADLPRLPPDSGIATANVPSRTQPPATGPKTSIADWTATASDDDDINNFYSERRQRGGRRKRKKNQRSQETLQNWDDIYDPSRPNNYEEYKNSEEKIREVREWKDLLYAHRMNRRSSSYDSDSDERRRMNRSFAPPPMSFAPPMNLNAEPETSTPPPSPPPIEIPDDATGEDAYARRMRLSQAQYQPPPPPPPPPAVVVEQAPPPGHISRAPVRYVLPLPPTELPASEAELEAKLANDLAQTTDDVYGNEDQPRSNLPGQAGFAERLLSKYGWTKGSGLGAQGTGIVNPLYAKVDKRKKKSDAEGGGFATPAGTGKILGGQKSKAAREEEQGKFGAMSEVIRLEGMLRGMDLDEEMARSEGGGIMQEIGEECGEKYGTVERVYIHRDGGGATEMGPMVFVKFVSQLSALRAVNALEGRVFNGNGIKARFWEREMFDQAKYE